MRPFGLVAAAVIVSGVMMTAASHGDPCERFPTDPRCTPTTTAPTTTIPGTTTTVDPTDHFVESIAVTGVSNSREKSEGYHLVSDKDWLVLLHAPENGQCGTTRWADGHQPCWDVYNNHRPASGYTAIWHEITFTARQHDSTGIPNTTHEQAIIDLVARFQASDPQATIFMSGINHYVNVCDMVGPNGDTLAANLADWAAASFPSVQRGPDTGPMDHQHVSDGCHLSPEGEQLAGLQLDAFPW